MKLNYLKEKNNKTECVAVPTRRVSRQAGVELRMNRKNLYSVSRQNFEAPTQGDCRMPPLAEKHHDNRQGIARSLILDTHPLPQQPIS